MASQGGKGAEQKLAIWEDTRPAEWPHLWPPELERTEAQSAPQDQREFTHYGAAPVVWLPPTEPWHLSEVPTEHCHPEDKLPAHEHLKSAVKPYTLSGFQMSAL